MDQLYIDRILTSAAALIAVVALAFGRPGDVEMAALAVFTAIIGKV